MTRPPMRRAAAPAPAPALELDGLLKRLHLANTRRAWRDLLVRAEQEEWTYEQLLSTVVAEEIAHRQQTRLERLCRRARFPFLKTIDDFDCTYQSTLRLALLKWPEFPENARQNFRNPHRPGDTGRKRDGAWCRGALSGDCRPFHLPAVVPECGATGALGSVPIVVSWTRERPGRRQVRP